MSSLLKLPLNLSLEKAKILLLRITVPADLYKSGILIEIEGVEIRLRAGSAETEKREKTGLNTRNARFSKGVKADRYRSTQSLVRDPEGLPQRPYPDTDEDDDKEQSNQIPTTNDLAQSFLQAEPPWEKAELQATIAHSHHLEQSQASSDSGDEVSGPGVGDRLSLPGFLADFLKGVVERVQLRVKKVEVDVVLNLDLPSEISNSSDTFNNSEAVTVRLLIEEVNLDGVTNEYSTSGDTKPQENTKSAIDGALPSTRNRVTRRVSLQNVHGILLSDASVFANVSRFVAPSSPEATQTSAFGKPNRRSEASTAHWRHSSSSNDTGHQATSEIGAARAAETPSVLENSMATSDGEMFTDARFEDGLEELISPNDARYHHTIHEHDSVLTDSFYSYRSGSQYGHENIMESEILPPSLRYRQVSQSMASSSVSEERIETQRPRLRTPSARHNQLSSPQSSTHSSLESQLTAESVRSGQPDISARKHDLIQFPEQGRQTSAEDLTQSKIFSHEEAESMYMSAISHASSRNSGRSRTLPGDWDNSSSDGEEKDTIPSLSPEGSPQDRDYVPPIQIEDSFCKQEAQDYPIIQDHELPFTPKQSRTSTASLSSLETTSAVRPEAVLNSTLPNYASSQRSEVSSAKSENPLIILKRFMSVDSIILEIDHEQRTATTEPVDLAPFTGKIHDPPPYIRTSSTIPPLSNDEIEKVSWQDISLEVGNVELQSDMGLTRLTILMMQHITEMFGSTPTKKKDVALSKPSSRPIKLKVQNISWKFVDSVKGVTVADSRVSLAEVGTMPLTTGAEILLKAVVKDLGSVYRAQGPSMSFKLSIRKLSFGYDSSDIISFDSGLKIRESSRDILAPIDNDMVIVFSNTRGNLKFEFTTLPLHISLDLRRLDETFGWFGGFSSMLGLGSSMVSTVTVVDKSRSPQLGNGRRGVHFETPEQTKSRDIQSDPQQKITARLGGLVLDLHGTSSSVRLESTALKLVSRAEGLGVQLDKVNFSGPYMRLADEVPSITIKLANIRLEYLSTPKEVDLARLLSLLSPSKDKYEHDDDILLDTLLCQRRQGGVIRATIESFDCRVSELRDLESFPVLAEELKKLSTVTKYLPEDDRPGVLTLGLVRNSHIEVFVNSSFGTTMCNVKNVEVAHVTLPNLTALGIASVQVHRNQSEELLGEALSENLGHEPPAPMIMGRFVGNEMEPTIKIKLHNLRVEYHVSTIMAIMGMSDTMTAEAIVADIANSIATVTNRRELSVSPAKSSSQTSSSNDRSTSSSKTLLFDIGIRNSVVGLNPRNSSARGLIVLTNTQLVGTLPKEDEASATLEVRKASLMVIDDVQNIVWSDDPMSDSSSGTQYSQVRGLSDIGYVSVGYVSAAKAALQVVKAATEEGQSIDVEFRDDLLVLETCADSTQTLQLIMNGLKPPMPPSVELKYRTEVVPVQDMLASLSGDAFVTGEASDGNDDNHPLGFEEGDMVDDEVPQNLEFVSSFYNPDPDGLYDGIANSMLEEDLETIASPPGTREIGDKRLLESFQEKCQVAPGGAPLDFRDDHFGASSTVGGTAHRWDTKQNTYGLTNDFKTADSPLRVRVRDVHFIWNLFDGYDWQHTRDVISQAVADVQSKATERRSKADRRKSFEAEEEEESVIGDFLFNSIYIGIPANRDPKELSRHVNRNLDDLISEAESYATSSASGSPSRQSHMPRAKGRRLRLSRSKYHKMTFELKGVSADLVVFPSGLDETQSSLDIRIQDLEIFDHVPTSTWKKFATYMHDAGEREIGTSMVHVEILNVKPVPTLAASEIILKVSS